VGEKPRTYQRWLVLGVWLLVGCLYFYMSYDFIRFSMKNRNLGEYMDYIVQLAGNEYRPPKEVRTLILVKAKELGLPVRNEQITVSGEGQTLEVRLNYGVDIEIPGIERVVYRQDFQHNVKYHPYK
jgi:hypothetical protein